MRGRLDWRRWTGRRHLIVFDARVALCARDRWPVTALVVVAVAATARRAVSAGTRVRKQLPSVLRGRRTSRHRRVCPSAFGRKVVDGDAKSAENRRRRSDRRCRDGRSAVLFSSSSAAEPRSSERILGVRVPCWARYSAMICAAGESSGLRGRSGGRGGKEESVEA